MEKENASEIDALYDIVQMMNIVHLVTNAMAIVYQKIKVSM